MGLGIRALAFRVWPRSGLDFSAEALGFSA